MARLNNRIRQSSVAGEGAAPKGSFGQDDRLPPKTTIAGLRIGGEEKAYPIAALQSVRVVNDRVGGVPVLIVHQPSTVTTTAFDARVKGRVLRFEASNAEASSLVDQETHSTWDAYGLCI